MKIKEFVKEVMANAFTGAEIIKYCEALDRDLLVALVEELWMEWYSFDGVAGAWEKANRMRDAYNLICEHFNVDIWEEHPAPQQGETNSGQGNTLNAMLPGKLQTIESVDIFKKAIDANLIEQTTEGLKWKAPKQLLAYFAERMSKRLHLSDIMDKDGNLKTSWKPFEILFGVKDLKGAKQNWMRLNTRFEPTGYEKVDALF